MTKLVNGDRNSRLLLRNFSANWKYFNIVQQNAQMSFHGVKLLCYKWCNIKSHIHTSEHNVGKEDVYTGRNSYNKTKENH